MALTDDLKDYIARNCTNTTVIKEKHNVAIVAETHALLRTPGSEIRTTATVRLLLELLGREEPDRLPEAGRRGRRRRGRDHQAARRAAAGRPHPADLAGRQDAGDDRHDRDWTDKRANPFRRVTFGSSKVSVAESSTTLSGRR